VHFVDEGTDTGPAVLRREVPVEQGDTVDTLSRRILEAEHVAYPEAVARVLQEIPPIP
jgi:phosphoribosylglycinamide formyltransferase-1